MRTLLSTFRAVTRHGFLRRNQQSSFHCVSQWISDGPVTIFAWRLFAASNSPLRCAFAQILSIDPSDLGNRLQSSCWQQNTNYYFWPTNTKPVGTKTLRKWNNGLHRASWWWTCFEMRPHCPSVVSATDSCWNRKLDSLASPVMLAVRLPISCTSSTAWLCHVFPVIVIIYYFLYPR